MRHLLGAALCVGVLLIGINTVAHANIVNGDFSNGLTGWTLTGSVAVENGVAVLRDIEAISSLSQNADLVPGLYRLEFDYMIGSIGSARTVEVVPDVGPPTSEFFPPDFFAASLYFSPDPDFLHSIELFQVSGSPDVTLGQWNHFSLDFENQDAGIIPTFELIDGNFFFGEDTDSAIYIDNVSAASVSEVPEPETWLVLIAGLIMLAGIEARRFLTKTTR